MGLGLAVMLPALPGFIPPIVVVSLLFGEERSTSGYLTSVEATM